VVVPLLRARIEESRERAGLWIKRSDVRTFVLVTVKALISEILQLRFAPMLLGDHVIDLVAGKVSFFRQVTILAVCLGALPYLGS